MVDLYCWCCSSACDWHSVSGWIRQQLISTISNFTVIFSFLFNISVLTLWLFDNSCEAVGRSVLYQPQQHKTKLNRGIITPLSALRTSLIHHLFLSFSESWFHLAWQICGSHRRRCYNCSDTALNTAGSECLGCNLENGWWRCAPPLHVWLQPLSRISTAAANCSMPPRSAGLVLMLAGKNVLVGKSWRGNRKGKASTGRRGGEFLVLTKNTHVWWNRPSE